MCLTSSPMQQPPGREQTHDGARGSIASAVPTPAGGIGFAGKPGQVGQFHTVSLQVPGQGGICRAALFAILFHVACTPLCIK